MKFINVANEWKQTHYLTLSENTKACYNPALRRAIKCFSDKNIEEIKPMDIKNLLDSLVPKNLSKQTIKIQRIVLKLIFDYAILAEYTNFNPVLVVKLPKNLRVTKRIMPSDDMIQAVRDSVNLPMGLFANFILYTGCRKGEALAIKYEDIYRKNNVIYINKKINYAKNSPALEYILKSEAGERYIPLVDKLEKLLPKKKRGFIFTNENNNLYTKTKFHNAWKKYCRSIGMTERHNGVERNLITCHMIRHAYATFLFESKVSEKDAQEILGHSSILVTKDIYTHIRKKHKLEVTSTLNDYFNTNSHSDF